MGVIGGVAVVLSVVIIVAYRSYRYEQELDSLLWKIDPIELKVIIYGDYNFCIILFNEVFKYVFIKFQYSTGLDK